ncbi:hypothetical protein SBOR_9155 [Sclerotinia borealis F-4128]|uniref:Pentatricopeptide repeat domain-containing protein n=1 Tax=Sclerotinia borealis (strain F-4128) TaxID=1432307 RepID=W9C3K7_SCLBF|nr:hypothetical protein SBOR_9155 [Sclerotinia borealis F-4128]
MGPFLRGVETRKSIIATRLSAHSNTEFGTKYNGKRWFSENKNQKNTGSQEETGINRLNEGDEGTNNALQAPLKQLYWQRFTIRNKRSNAKTFFKTPSWMKMSWNKEENLKEWWSSKHATEKSQSQEAYGDIYPLEIPTSINEQDETSDSSDMVSLIRRVGVGLPLNLTQRRILLKEAKMVVGYKDVLRAVQIRDPHELLKVLVKLSEVDNYHVNYSPLLEIPPNTFSEIMRLMDPKYFFGRHRSLLKDFRHEDLLEMRIDTVDYNGTHRAYTVYLWHLHRIIMKRQQRHPLHLSEYKMLLKAAKFTGNQAVADLTWKALLSNRHQVTQARRVLPDVECFNYYMATMCWSDVLSPFHSERLRVVPHYKELRQLDVIPYALNRHRLGPDNGIGISVSRLFREMVAIGLMGDEETFCLLMVSASREGDLKTAETILKRVWNIDTESNNSVNSKLDILLPDSPLYPSKRLFRTITHIYCINNDLPMALRVSDHVSRKYSIKIPLETWQDIIEWTAVFAKKRGSALYRERGFDEGILPPAGMNDVWRNMISEPYNIRPTLPMYNIYIRNLLSRRQIGEAQGQIAEARRLHYKLAREVHRYRILYENSLMRRNPDSAVTNIRQRNFTFQRLRLRTSRMYMRQWINTLIHRPAEYLSKYHVNWAVQEIPTIIKNYKSFLRGTIAYQTYTGHVQLKTGTPQATKFRIWRRRYGNTGPRKRRLRRSLKKLLMRKEFRYNRNRTAAGGKFQLAAKIVQNHRAGVE